MCELDSFLKFNPVVVPSSMEYFIDSFLYSGHSSLATIEQKNVINIFWTLAQIIAVSNINRKEIWLTAMASLNFMFSIGYHKEFFWLLKSLTLIYTLDSIKMLRLKYQSLPSQLINTIISLPYFYNPLLLQLVIRSCVMGDSYARGVPLSWYC